MDNPAFRPSSLFEKITKKSRAILPVRSRFRLPDWNVCWTVLAWMQLASLACALIARRSFRAGFRRSPKFTSTLVAVVLEQQVRRVPGQGTWRVSSVHEEGGWERRGARRDPGGLFHDWCGHDCSLWYTVGRLQGLFERSKAPGACLTPTIKTTQPHNTGSTDSHRTAPSHSAHRRPAAVGWVEVRSIQPFTGAD